MPRSDLLSELVCMLLSDSTGVQTVVMRMSRGLQCFPSTGTEHCKAAKVQGLVAVQITHLSVGDGTPRCRGRHTSVQGLVCTCCSEHRAGLQDCEMFNAPSCKTFFRIVQLFKYLSCMFSTCF